MSPNVASIMVLALLGSFLQSSSFVLAPIHPPQVQVCRSGTPSHFSTSLPSVQHERPYATTRQRSSRASRPVSAPCPLSWGKIDMIDPLEAGPDPEEPVEEDAVDEATAEGGVVEDDAPSVAMAALEAATKEVAEEQKKEMEMEVQKKERKKMEKSTHGGCEGPIVWSEFSELEDGCRAHLVVYHTGSPTDQKLADIFLAKVKERHGGVVNVVEEVVTDDVLRESGWQPPPPTRASLREPRMLEPFEIWLDGPQPILYHARAESRAEFTEQHIEGILEDLEYRVSDDYLLGTPVGAVTGYRTPGYTKRELKIKQFTPL